MDLVQLKEQNIKGLIQMAKELGISRNTVRQYVRAMEPERLHSRKLRSFTETAFQ